MPTGSGAHAFNCPVRGGGYQARSCTGNISELNYTVYREHSRYMDLHVQGNNGTEALRRAAKVWNNIYGNRTEAN